MEARKCNGTMPVLESQREAPMQHATNFKLSAVRDGLSLRRAVTDVTLPSCSALGRERVMERSHLKALNVPSSSLRDDLLLEIRFWDGAMTEPTKGGCRDIQ